MKQVTICTTEKIEIETAVMNYEDATQDSSSDPSDDSSCVEICEDEYEMENASLKQPIQSESCQSDLERLERDEKLQLQS